MNTLQDRYSQIKMEIAHIWAAQDNPLLLTQINEEYSDDVPIRDKVHLTRLVNTRLPFLQNELEELHHQLHPIVKSVGESTYTLPPKRYSKTYESHVYLSKGVIIPTNRKQPLVPNKWTDWKTEKRGVVSREMRTTASIQPWDPIN